MASSSGRSPPRFAPTDGIYRGEVGNQAAKVSRGQMGTKCLQEIPGGGQVKQGAFGLRTCNLVESQGNTRHTQSKDCFIKGQGRIHQKCQHHKRKKPQKCFRFKEAKNNEYRVKGKGRRKMLEIRFWCTTVNILKKSLGYTF